MVLYLSDAFSGKYWETCGANVVKSNIKFTVLPVS